MALADRVDRLKEFLKNKVLKGLTQMDPLIFRPLIPLKGSTTRLKQVFLPQPHSEMLIQEKEEGVNLCGNRTCFTPKLIDYSI